ncbi:MAG TPA: M56 family metallopeptidase [Chloroflexota bacterium]|nr:M56 family metallopeptidase [Chloroflexota bacterium]
MTRAFAALALVVPVPALLLAILAMFPVLAEACTLFLTSWDRFLTFLFLLLAASGLLYASVAPFVRMLALWRLRRNSVAAGPHVNELVERLVHRLRIARPSIIMTNDDRPFAKASSEFRPRLYISAGLLRRLDRDELEGVLAHELAHLTLQHHWTSCLTLLLRDATWFLPTAGLLRKKLHAGREAAADRLAAATTRKPAALASAILAIWECASGGKSGAMALAIVGDADDLPGRIGALLAMPGPPAVPEARRPMLARLIRLLPGGVMLFQFLALLLVLPLLGCGLDAV